jgi:tight adherence protein B
MIIAALVFIVAVGAVLGAYAAFLRLPAILARRHLDQRLQDVSAPIGGLSQDSSVLKRENDGPLPALDRLIAKMGAGLRLKRLIEQSACDTTPGVIVTASLALMIIAALATNIILHQQYFVPVAGAVGAFAPFAFLLRRRSIRLKKFEEAFPEALDLLSRALRAGHAFQASMGMIGDEMKAPVGPEFKKTFDQQNFGLPLRESLHQLTERVPILDVRFFVTAVLIQRETGGNLSEILDNLGHVVRERFKIHRQVRVHTAHGRFTAIVLLSLPAALGIALTYLNPEHMELLFRERMGQMMLVAAMVMQAIGFVWIRKVIKIEV